MSRKLRLPVIKDLLRSGRTVTAGMLAERFECSERSIQRDIEDLRTNEKWPIDAGRNGYYLRDRSIAETKVTAPSEVAALVMAYDTLNRLNSSELAKQLKLSLLDLCVHAEGLTRFEWNKLQTAVNRREKDGEADFNHAIHGQLTLAILQQYVVDIRYRRLEEDHEFDRPVFPQRLIQRDGCWYLIAWDLVSKAQRTYALPRIAQVTIQPAPKNFVIPEFQDIHEHAFGIWTPYEDDGTLYEVCVELYGYWARIAKERHWHPSQRIEELNPDCVRIHFQLSELVEVKSWVLKFGGAAKVITPPALQGLVRKELKEMLKLNEGC